MRIAILSRSVTEEIFLIKKTAEERNHSVNVIDPLNLIFIYNKGKFCIKESNNNSILDYDFYIPRYLGIKDKNGKRSRDKKGLISKYLIGNNKKLLDSIEAVRIGNKGKMFSYYKLAQHNLPLIPTLYLETYSNLNIVNTWIEKEELSFPLIIKDLHGVQGKNIFKVNNLTEINETLRNNPLTVFMLQKYINIKHDLRILVLKDKVLGTMEKIHAGGDFRGNIAAGAKGISFKLNEELENLALQALKASGSDFGGVDIAITENCRYVLEVNRAPQFKGFMKATGVNVPLELILYIESIFNRQ